MEASWLRTAGPLRLAILGQMGGSVEAIIRALIVEDDAIIAMDLEHMLIRLGYLPVGIVSRAADVVPAVRRTEPDLVLMDIRLDSGENGLTLAEEVYFREGVAVVFVTAFSDSRTVERMRKSGAYGCVLKPVEEERLNVALAVAVAKHRELLTVRLLLERFRDPPVEPPFKG